MKLIYLLIGIFLLLSCEKKELNEVEILEIIHSNKGFENLEFKKDFLTGENFIDSIKTFREIIAKENFKSIYEADFNNDGKKDYLVNLAYPKILNSNDVFKIHISEDNYSTAFLLSQNNGYKVLNPGKKEIYAISSAKIVRYGNQNLIKLLNFKRRIDDRNDMFEFDTLMIKDNQLTEFSQKQENHHIDKIIFTKINGYAPGIEYQLTLEHDSLILQSNYYKNLEGKFFGKNKNDFKEIAKHLNFINFNDLKERYSIICSDCNSIETKIIFDNEKTKTIYDYGEKGALSLLTLYEKIDSIMAQQKWNKLK